MSQTERNLCLNFLRKKRKRQKKLHTTTQTQAQGGKFPDENSLLFTKKRRKEHKARNPLESSCQKNIVKIMDLKNLLHTTPRYAKLLAENGMHTLKDFFNNFPRTYEDRSQISPLNALIFDEKGKTATKGLIMSKQYFPRGKGVYEITFQDENQQLGYISIFNS